MVHDTPSLAEEDHSQSNGFAHSKRDKACSMCAGRCVGELVHKKWRYWKLEKSGKQVTSVVGVVDNLGVACEVSVDGEMGVVGEVGVSAEMVVAREVSVAGEMGEVGVACEVGGSTVDSGPHCRTLYPKLQCRYDPTAWYAGREKASILESFCADHVNAQQVSVHSLCQWMWCWQTGDEREVVACVRHPYRTD